MSPNFLKLGGIYCIILHVRCNKCHIEKRLNGFSFKDIKRNIRKKICKQCHSLYRKQHYLLNREKYIEKAVIWNKKQKEILADFLFKKLSQSRCIDCKETDVIVLEFDHLKNKKFGIAEMYKNSYSLQAIEDELKKCVVRCANCHRRKTAKEIGYWKFKMSKI